MPPHAKSLRISPWKWLTTCTMYTVVVIIMGWIAFVVFYYDGKNESSPAAVATIDAVPITPATNSQSSPAHDISTDKYLRGDPEAIEENPPNFETIDTVGEIAHVHVVFSTDCTPYQDWQTLLIFHSAMAVGQKGTISRIASGCDDVKKVQLTELYAQLFPQYHVHFTPDYKTDAKTKKSYDFYNKPYGVLHWLEEAQPPVESGVMVAIIDPDFVFLRPLTTKLTGNAFLVSGDTHQSDVFDYITLGKPAAQQYGLGAPWVNDQNQHFNRTRICGANSPCLRVPNWNVGAKHYSAGPPYIMEKSDLHRVAKRWVEFVPRVYEAYPDLLAEMYAYSMAAAHEELPHLRPDHFMVSNVLAGGEGWQWVDALPDVCTPPVNGVYFPDKPLPTFLHYCQFFRAAEIGFHKRRVYKDIFSCERPMLMDLPRNLSLVDYKNRDGEVSKHTFVYRNLF